MLAKQAWRIASNPKSLIARIYKARYFPEGSFWSASAHSTPSYSWRSIFGTRELLRSGSYWQIGTGENVRVWADAWIPGLPNLGPHYDGSVGTADMRVTELISQPGLWDETMVRSLFNETEAEAILAIPLSRRLVHDRIAWKLEKKGDFSVKTAYRHAFSLNVERHAILDNTTTQFWKRIWQAKIPCKAKVHVWKICHNILPSLESLASKHVYLESQLCVLCIGGIESTLHLCRNCPFTRAVIQSSTALVQVCFTSESDEMGGLEWLQLCSNRLASPHFDLLLFLLWAVWKERNSRVCENKTKGVNDVVLMATSRQHEFIHHNSRSIDRGRMGVSEVRWQCPPVGYVKLNINGAFMVASGTGGIGLVFRDCTGHFLAAKGRQVMGLVSAEHTELLACKEALEWIMERALQPAIVETDSLVIKQQLSKSGANLSRLGRIYDDLGVLLGALPNVRIMHTRRDANNAAHLMAAKASTMNQAIFFSSVPSFLHDVINHELCTH